MTAPPPLHGAAGPATLGRELGRGGEGTVYEIAGRLDKVAKVYHKPPDQTKARKLELMAAMQSASLLTLTAWPVELLRGTDGQVRAFTMPRVGGHKDIHALYSPKSRKDEFPTADFRFLVRAAANTARAFAVTHATGCVIGDVNPGGLKVSKSATVKLIDCDSFQVSGPRGQVFTCDVGVSGFTAPELQGKPFRGLVRSANHDAFGLGVILFHMLFMGRHPFAGRWLGPGDMSVERAIEEHRFAYGHDRAARQMEPPPGMPPLIAMSTPVALLFERCFSSAGAAGMRPTAVDWIGALDALEQGLVQCDAHPRHQHFKDLKSCPWCAIESATGVELFTLQDGPRAPGTRATGDIRTVWQRILAVRPPGPPPRLATRRDLPRMRRSQPLGVRGYARLLLGMVARVARTSLALVLIGVVAASVVILNNALDPDGLAQYPRLLALIDWAKPWFFQLLGYIDRGTAIVVAIAWILLARNAHRFGASRSQRLIRRSAVNGAHRNWQGALQRYREASDPGRFARRRAELELLAARLAALAGRRPAMMAEARRAGIETARRRYLAARSLRHGE